MTTSMGKAVHIGTLDEAGVPEAWKVGVLALSPGRKEPWHTDLQLASLEALEAWHFVNSAILQQAV
jgi:hypothetical protein